MMIRLFLCGLVASFPLSASANMETLDHLMTLWAGTYDNHAQVESATDGLPGRVEEKRSVSVRPVTEAALGEYVLLLEERKAGEATIHRQRVHRLRWDEAKRAVRVEQLFFRDGPVYDRSPTTLPAIAELTEGDVEHVARCDLFLTEKDGAFTGGMTPRTCLYDHPRGGEVWAEFDMVLKASGYAYRDRSVQVENGRAKGEIEDFAWLRFLRQTDMGLSDTGLSPTLFPSLSRQLGVWEGEFQRIDANGETLARFPTRIEAALDEDGLYRQRNIYNPGTDAERVITSQGYISGDRLLFENDRVRGSAWDESETLSIFAFTLADGTNVHEVVTLSPDGLARHRAAQYVKAGRLIRRTVITEHKIK